MRKTTALLMVGFSLFFHSCCWSVKEDHLGKNFRLSEYDNVDRRILYSEERCSVSGIEIVPMTVTAYAYDSKWIIAKSRTSRFGREYQYWIIDKGFKINDNTRYDKTSDVIKSHVAGPLDSVSFVKLVHANRIGLTLKNIWCGARLDKITSHQQEYCQEWGLTLEQSAAVISFPDEFPAKQLHFKALFAGNSS